MKDKTLILHVGSPKTGTTSIQVFLKENTRALADVGINFVKTGRRNIAHNGMMQSFKTGNADDVCAGIAEEVATNPAQIHIVSSELFFRQGPANVLAAAFPDELRRITKVICYIRRQDKYLEAMYKQMVKNDRTKPDTMQFRDNRMGSLAYSKTLDVYSSHFGAENMIVRPFERRNFDNGDVVDDFMNQIGAPVPDDAIKPKQDANKTLSAPVSEMLGMLKRNSNVNTRELIRELIRQNAVGAIRSNDVYNIAIRRELVGQLKQDNEIVRGRYCPELFELFDLSDLESGEDPFPSPEQQVENWKSAAQAVVLGLSGLSVI